MSSGFRLMLHSTPPSQQRQPTTRLYKPDEKVFYQFELARRLQIGAIEKVPPAFLTPQALQRSWLSVEFLVPKKSDLPYRTVFNGHGISKYLLAPPTHLHDLKSYFQRLPRGAWIYGYDLRDAFYALPVHLDDRRLLMFRFDSLYYWYRSLPMGISPSAAHLCQVTMALCEYWSHQLLLGHLVQILPYFDDLNGWALLREIARAHSLFVQKEIELLGLHWNKTKSMPEPAQQAIILGYNIDTRTLTASLPLKKLQKIEQTVSNLLHDRRSSARALLSLAGKFMDARHASPFFRAIAYSIYPLLSMADTWDDTVPISEELTKRLHFFLQQASLLNSGRCFRYDPAVASTLITDANPIRWSWAITRGPLAGRSRNGLWSELRLPSPLAALPQHINALELLVPLLAISQLGEQLRSATLWWQVDNQAALSYVRKSGGPVDYMRELLWQILLETHRLHIFLTPPSYIRSERNPADYGTRHREVDPIRISRHTFDHLNLLYGPFSIDLFANSGNAVCPRFFASTQQDGAEAIDALAQDWSRLRRPWIFPPTDLLHLVVDKLLLQRPSGAVLIAPALSSTLWWPRLMSLSPHIHKLRPQDFKVDGPATSSIFLALSEHFIAAQIP